MLRSREPIALQSLLYYGPRHCMTLNHTYSSLSSVIHFVSVILALKLPLIFESGQKQNWSVGFTPKTGLIPPYEKKIHTEMIVIFVNNTTYFHMNLTIKQNIRKNCLLIQQ